MAHSDELASKRQLQAQCEVDLRALVAQYPALTAPLAQTRFTTYTAICQQTPTEGYGMPAKDYRMLGEDMENVAMRLPKSVLMEVDAHIERLHVQAPWARCGRSDALRDLVLRGLASVTTPTVARQESQSALSLAPVETSPLVPHETLTPQPQEPSAVVPETSTVVLDLDTETSPPQPEKPSMAPTGMKQCKQGHGFYSASKSECPTCARNRMRRKRQPQPSAE